MVEASMLRALPTLTLTIDLLTHISLGFSITSCETYPHLYKVKLLSGNQKVDMYRQMEGWTPDAIPIQDAIQI